MTRSPRLGCRSAVLLLAAVIFSALGGCASHHPDGPASVLPESEAQPICPPAPSSAVKGAAAVLPKDGCWNTANLAKMVVDPRDLTQGKPLGPANGARESAAIEAYQRGQPAPLNAPGSTRPTITINGGLATGGQ